MAEKVCGNVGKGNWSEFSDSIPGPLTAKPNSSVSTVRFELSLMSTATLLWPRRSVAVLSLRNPGFDLGLFCVVFVADGVAMQSDFVRVFRSPPLSTIAPVFDTRASFTV